MKKLGLILFTVLTISVLAFALDGNGNGELNIFLGADISANEKVKQQDRSTVTENNAKKGFSLGAEWLYPVLYKVKIGAGGNYLFEREHMSIMPLYATVQVNPIEKAKGFFLKLNIGYDVYFNVDIPDSNYALSIGDNLTINQNGGFYWGIGAGYEFAFGIFAGLFYDAYAGSTDVELKNLELGYDINRTVKYTYNTVSLKAGYKFQL
ncbi:MAG: hypothetical protein LBH33_02380 [Endomicrobium sp.]|jgi:hypothetical protein|nr:hypothetical protein [Endomicrobium sp.]